MISSCARVTPPGQALGFYKAGEVAGFIGAVIGTMVILIVYGFIAGGRAHE